MKITVTEKLERYGEERKQGRKGECK